MLKESDKLTDTLIQIIQSLPETKKEKIARNIFGRKKHKSKINKAASGQKKKMQDFISHMEPYTGRLPKGYKFDREEANER
ncbi:MAG: hypothetical protein SH857_02055 [Chitinophagales bacterium]|nr:hypothetical protein [Chitinophagales bacterium]